MLEELSVDRVWISTIVTFLAVGVGAAMLVRASKIYKRFMYIHSLPGYEEFSLIYGNLHLLPKDPEARLQLGESRMRRNKFKFHVFWVGPFIPYFTVYHPDLVKKILQSTAPKSRGVGSVYEMILPWIGEGLIAANGKRWARSRKLLTPAFHFEILKDYMQVFNEAADNLFKKLDKFAETGESFDICPLITLCTLEVILKCSLSYDQDVQGAGHPYAEAVSKMTNIFSERVRRPWLWPSWIFKLSSMGSRFHSYCDYVHKLAEDVIQKRMESLENYGVRKGRRLDFIDILLTARDQNGQSMSLLEIRNEVDTFMFAGHDTTASAIPWCLFSLAQHPEYQKRIQEEVDDILDGRGDEEILLKDLPHLKTLAICGKEAMRVYPPVPFIQRELLEEMDFEGHKIPAGSFVSVAIYLLHRNPAVWDEPQKFHPERFLVENKKAMDSHAFVPFSSGSRNCIGQNFALDEEKVIISRILRRYNVQVAPDKDLPKKRAAAILRAENGIWLRLKRR